MKDFKKIIGEVNSILEREEGEKIVILGFTSDDEKLADANTCYSFNEKVIKDVDFNADLVIDFIQNCDSQMRYEKDFINKNGKNDEIKMHVEFYVENEKNEIIYENSMKIFNFFFDKEYKKYLFNVNDVEILIDKKIEEIFDLGSCYLQKFIKRPSDYSQFFNSFNLNNQNDFYFFEQKIEEVLNKNYYLEKEDKNPNPCQCAYAEFLKDYGRVLKELKSEVSDLISKKMICKENEEKILSLEF